MYIYLATSTYWDYE